MRIDRTAGLLLVAALTQLLTCPALASQRQLRNLAPETFVSPGNTTLVGATASGPLFLADNAYGTELWLYDVGADRARQLRDVNPGREDGVYGNFTPALGKLFFRAGGPLPIALYCTDGTDQGTVRLAETQLRSPTEFAGALWFEGEGGVSGSELWRSDGTPAGTGLVVDLGVGLASITSLDDLIPLRGRLCFTGRGGPTQLYSVDDQGGDLRNLTAFGPFSNSRVVAGSPVRVGDEIWFLAVTLASGLELWSTDGTVAGTRLRVETVPGADFAFASSRTPLVPLGDGVLFAGNDPVSGVEPWFSDGTSAGTGPLADIFPGTASSIVAEQFFVAWPAAGLAMFAADDGSTGVEPWVTDGTPAGTQRLADVLPGALGSRPTSIQATSRGFFFTAEDSLRRQILWVSGGSPATTLRVTINAAEPPPRPSRFLEAAGRIWFDSDQAFGGLWWTDGLTAQPTARLGAGTDSDPEVLLATGGEAYLSFASGNTLAGLLVTDGTDPGTQVVFGDGTAWPGSSVRSAIVFRDEVWFAARSDTLRERWFATDGSAAGTRPVWSDRGVRPATQPSAVLFAGRLVFYGLPFGTSRNQLVITDGTEVGTEVLTSFSNTVVGLSASDAPVVSADGSYFVFPGGVTSFDREPWVSDGTVAGTGVLTEVRPGLSGSNPTQFQRFGDHIVFFATSDVARDLWITDGTTVGTRALGVFDASSFLPGNEFVVESGALWFAGRARPGGYQLYRLTDPAGTPQAITDLPGYGSGRGLLLGNGQGRVFFTKESVEDALELWASDGTPAGTVQITVEAPGRLPGYLRATAAAHADSGFVLFAGISERRGVQLWASDGTPANTFEVGLSRIGAGTGVGAARIERPTVFGSGVLFAAEAGFEGLEPWIVSAEESFLPYVETFAEGCVGSSGAAPEQALEGWPRLGEVGFASRVGGGRAGAPAVLLASRGARFRDFDGCQVAIQTPAEVAGALDLDASGAGRAVIGVPVDVGLVGLELYLQWAVLDEGAALAGSVALSDVERIRVGR